jgi:hypothetical protein
MADLSVCSQALAPSLVVKQTGNGILRRLAVQIDSAAATGNFYVHVLQGAQGQVPPNGTLPSGVSFLRAPRHVNHVSGTSDNLILEESGEGGVEFEGGLLVLLSTAQTTVALAGAYLLVDADIHD